jgi:hypothetical protein
MVVVDDDDDDDDVDASSLEIGVDDALLESLCEVRYHGVGTRG